MAIVNFTLSISPQNSFPTEKSNLSPLCARLCSWSQPLWHKGGVSPWCQTSPCSAYGPTACHHRQWVAGFDLPTSTPTSRVLYFLKLYAIHFLWIVLKLKDGSHFWSCIAWLQSVWALVQQPTTYLQPDTLRPVVASAWQADQSPLKVGTSCLCLLENTKMIMSIIVVMAFAVCCCIFHQTGKVAWKLQLYCKELKRRSLLNELSGKMLWGRVGWTGDTLANCIGTTSGFKYNIFCCNHIAEFQTPAPNSYLLHKGQTNKGKFAGAEVTFKSRASPYVYPGFQTTGVQSSWSWILTAFFLHNCH